VTLTPNASAVGGESVSRPTVEPTLFQTLAGGFAAAALWSAEARSVQAEFPADGLEFRRLNQICMGNRDGMQGTGEFGRPEVQKFPQFGKVRMEVVKLQDKALQDARMIGHPIENIGGGQTKTFELAAKVGRDHVALRRVGTKRFSFAGSPQEKKYRISHLISYC
jgi:hypothetical protein